MNIRSITINLGENKHQLTDIRILDAEVLGYLNDNPDSGIIRGKGSAILTIDGYYVSVDWYYNFSQSEYGDCEDDEYDWEDVDSIDDIDVECDDEGLEEELWGCRRELLELIMGGDE